MSSLEGAWFRWDSV